MSFNSPSISVPTPRLRCGLGDKHDLPTCFLFLHQCFAIPVLCEFSGFPAKQNLACSLQRHARPLQEMGSDVYSRLHCAMLVWDCQFFWGWSRGRILYRDPMVCFTGENDSLPVFQLGHNCCVSVHLCQHVAH